MARFEILDDQASSMGTTTHADILFDLGLMYATGRDCAVDLVAAHKWFNIAAIKGCERAGSMRAEVSASMNKADLAKALRQARDWMTVH